VAVLHGIALRVVLSLLLSIYHAGHPLDRSADVYRLRNTANSTVRNSILGSLQ
jgi:hypothetical protein